MRLVEDANNRIEFYTQRNYIHCYVTEGGNSTGERFETIGTSLNEYKIIYNNDYDRADFYFNDTLKKQIYLSSDFNNLKLTYIVGNDDGTGTMTADSCWVTDQYDDTAEPMVEITSCGVDESGANPEAYASIDCNNGPYMVEARIERVEGVGETVEQYKVFYESPSPITAAYLSYTFGSYQDFGEGTGWWRMRITVDDKDEIFTNCFYYDSTTNDVLLSSAASEQAPPSIALPKAFSLKQNLPNPFNPSTSISYQIPDGNEAVNVELNVYDVRGRLIKRLVSSLHQQPGTYNVNWNGKDDQGSSVASGVYFYRLQAGDFSATRKMVLLK